MAVAYGKFEMPTKIDVEADGQDERKARFVAEPFERGFAHTLGNSLRRILLSSLEAPAIVSVAMQGVDHEYMAVDGVVEDVTDILLNFKGALLRRLPSDEDGFSREYQELTNTIEITQADLDKADGNVEVTFGDVVQEGLFEIVNPDLYLFTVTKPMKRQISLKVGIGRGYVPSERIEMHDRKTNEILLDAAFSPVKLVNYYVENTRVGQDTDFDRLILEITTDGRVTPKEALTFASQIATKHFEVFEEIKTDELAFLQEVRREDRDQDEIMEKLALRIDEIELSVRSANCLSGANIDTIAQLVSIPERKMLDFRNFGKKSLNEIKAKLYEMGLSLGMDLSKYGLTAENMDEKLEPYIREKAEFQFPEAE